MGIFSSEQNAFGFDLSDVSIKVMQMSKSSKGGYRVEGFNTIQIPRGVMVNDIIMDEKMMEKYIRSAMRNTKLDKISGNRVIASLPESKAFVRVIQIPKMSEDKAAAAVPFEAEQFIPMPLDQVYLDWQIINTTENGMDILVTAVPRDYADNFLRVLKNAGLQPIAFEVESAACARSLIEPTNKQGTNHEKSLLIVDMGNFRSSIITCEGGSLEYTLSVPISGDSFTDALVHALGYTLEQAEAIKIQYGLALTLGQEKVRETLGGVVDNLILEIINSIRFHDEHAEKKISEILLCGGAAKLTGLTEYIHEKLAENPMYENIEVKLGNPWVNVLEPKSVESTKLLLQDSLDYTTAIGLAMRGADRRDDL